MITPFALQNSSTKSTLTVSRYRKTSDTRCKFSYFKMPNKFKYENNKYVCTFELFAQSFDLLGNTVLGREKFSLIDNNWKFTISLFIFGELHFKTLDMNFNISKRETQ